MGLRKRKPSWTLLYEISDSSAAVARAPSFVKPDSGRKLLEDEEKLKVRTIQFGEKMNEVRKKMKVAHNVMPNTGQPDAQISLLYHTRTREMSFHRKNKKAPLFSTQRNLFNHCTTKLLHMDLPSCRTPIAFHSAPPRSERPALPSPHQGCHVPATPRSARRHSSSWARHWVRAMAPLSVRLLSQPAAYTLPWNCIFSMRRKIITLVPLEIEMFSSFNSH